MSFRPASALQILADFLCTPVSMHPARHAAFVRELVAGRLQPPAPIRAGDTKKTRCDDGEPADVEPADDCEPPCEPWDEPIYTVENGIACIEVCGPLVKGCDNLTCYYYGLASIDRLHAAVTELAARLDVAAVVFNLNTPGGMSAGMPELCRAIARMGQRQMTIALNGNMAASNGCRIAVACNYIFVTPSSVNGCIGTYVALYDYTAMLAAQGIKLELFKRGTYKGLGFPGKPLSKEERAFLDADVGRSNDQFTAFVRERRSSVADSTMQGQWFDGEQAVALGLADKCVDDFTEVMANVRAAIYQAVTTAP